MRVKRAAQRWWGCIGHRAGGGSKSSRRVWRASPVSVAPNHTHTSLLLPPGVGCAEGDPALHSGAHSLHCPAAQRPRSRCGAAAHLAHPGGAHRGAHRPGPAGAGVACGVLRAGWVGWGWRRWLGGHVVGQSSRFVGVLGGASMCPRALIGVRATKGRSMPACLPALQSLLPTLCSCPRLRLCACCCPPALPAAA